MLFLSLWFSCFVHIWSGITVELRTDCLNMNDVKHKIIQIISRSLTLMQMIWFNFYKRVLIFGMMDFHQNIVVIFLKLHFFIFDSIVK